MLLSLDRHEISTIDVNLILTHFTNSSVVFFQSPHLSRMFPKSSPQSYCSKVLTSVVLFQSPQLSRIRLASEHKKRRTK